MSLATAVMVATFSELQEHDVQWESDSEGTEQQHEQGTETTARTMVAVATATNAVGYEQQ